jgi:N-methylhydantoinase B
LARALKPGERYTLRSGGGGGYGSPLNRPIEKIAADLQEGYITPARAERLYGIVFGSEAGTIDSAKTEMRRTELAAQSLPVDDIEFEPPEELPDTHMAARPMRLAFRCC